MLFSIIVPVYNVQEYLEECIESIIPQIVGFEDGAELILIDDGSTDQSGKICDEYRKVYPDIIKVYHKKNEGLLLTRRFGFKKAQGEYILNCDSDDMCVKTQISDLSKIIKKTQADVIIFNSYTINQYKEKKIFFKNIFGNEKLAIVDKRDVLIDYMSSYRTVSMCCKVFTRNCLNIDYDYYSYGKLSYGEDTMQSAEIYTLAQTFAYYNKPLYYYRINLGMTTEYKKDYYTQYKKVCLYIKKYCKHWELDNVDRLMALKIFSIVGRAITQSRLNIEMTFDERKSYLKKMRKDSMIQEYEQYYRKIRPELQNSYKIMCSLFLSEHYRLIDILLRLKNI